MSSKRYVLLCELTGYTDVATSVVKRYSNRPYWTAPTDTPANEWYDDRILDAGFFKRTMFPSGESGFNPNPPSATATVDYGNVVLGNLDGKLDAVFGATSTISFRERQIRMLIVEEGAAYSTAVVLYKASISQHAHTREAVTVSVKDRSYELNSPHQTLTYGGTNVLPAGVDGGPEMAGKTRPKGYGKVLMWEPPLVNASKYIYELNSTTIQSADLADGGNYLTRGADYTSQADMEANTPAAGGYRLWISSGGSYARIETKPTYRLTADVTYSTTGNSTVAQIIKQMALDRGIASGDINASDVTALDAANSSVNGIVFEDTRTTLDGMRFLALGIGAAAPFDQLGVLRLYLAALPSGSAVAVLANWNQATLVQITNNEDTPTLDVRLRYAHYRAALAQNQIAGAVTGAAYADVQLPWRVAKTTTTLSPNPYKRTQVMERDSGILLKTAADTESQRVLDIVKEPHRTHVASNVFVNEATLQVLDLNKVVELRYDRYGFDPVVGTNRRVIGLTFWFMTRRCDLTLWGE